MTIIAGIDEAGYGPVLGPLVITVAAFDVPDEKAHDSLWELLKEGVSDSLKDKKNRLCIRDSKKLYNARSGLKALEDAVLSFLHLTDATAAPSFYQLLDRLSCHDAGAIERYPWYAGKDYTLPVATSVSAVLNYANLLQYALGRHNVRFHYAGSCVLTVREFNEQVRLSGNKGAVLFRSCASLIAKLWDASGDTIHLTIDKQGGRNSYLDPLQEQFPTATFLAMEEGAKISTYEATNAQKKKMTLSFVEKGEESCMAVALASLFSKYVRELFMRLENQYWLQCMPGLKPTAGYYEDAHRFLSQIAPVMREQAIQEDILIRIR
ncbi:MAG TPA: hypothetical protein VJ440_09370 [Candidatus Brocadiaceae bacterium]|nr:hypothetical protein [Candidatus Brocadiaceae bacterium]